MATQGEDAEVTRIWSAAAPWSGRPRLVLLVSAPAGISEFELPESGTIQVGRAAACAISVLDPSVSRVHAEISVNSTDLSVKDLGSRNGTFVNDQRLGDETMRLRPGDFLRFGSAQAQLQLWTRPFARSLASLPEESFLNRLMV